ncbi:MAG: 23S rRNA (pseudouridine(1915)-N(3))-methyltransferase RlmH [Clostridia bacterium]|nr:23S rRNA (pseudouridine(1915)-N(3))-methyltransferase RlmH [Clostridia bacterium]
MLKITVISVGQLKESYYRQAIDEYEKRMSAFCKISNINLKETPFDEKGGESLVSAALEQEGERILSQIPKNAYKIALCIEGKELSSEQFAGVLDTVSTQFGECVFIIGSSHGLCDKVKKACDMRLSLSKMTFPHRLARVMLSEALYRSLSINAGRKYHK